jgi:hypothetical protein
LDNLDIPFLTDTVPRIAVELSFQSNHRCRNTIQTSSVFPINGTEEKNGENQIIGPKMVSSTPSSATPPSLGLQTSWSRLPLGQTRPMEPGPCVDGKRLVEEAWLENNEPTTVPMSFPKRRRVNPSDVEEPVFSFSQPSFDNEQGNIASMNDTQALLATSNPYSSINGDLLNYSFPTEYNISPHSFPSFDNLAPMPEDFWFHPNGEFTPSCTTTVVNGDGNFQDEFC